MQYLALLRDSFKEAMDSKVLYFTFALSVLAILFMASVSFQPMTAKDQADFTAEFVSQYFALQNPPGAAGPRRAGRGRGPRGSGRRRSRAFAAARRQTAWP